MRVRLILEPAPDKRPLAPLSWLRCVCLCLASMAMAASCFAAVACAADDEQPAPLSYERHVRPILKTHCFHCHGEGDELAGGLDLRLRRTLVQGGDSGAAVLPGSADQSLLLERMQAGDMPPEEVQIRPSPAELATIRRWIEQGAVTLRPEPERIEGGWYVTEEERQYWAFQPVCRPVAPAVQALDRVRTPIDQFILSRLEQQGLSFSAEADRPTLIRRASLDLLGLLPSPEDVERFVADESDDAYDRLLDRLLASPHYGQRWGRHWLDVAGYADSEGATDEDPPRPDAHKYRDYVIRAFYGDKPFDQFLMEQLAGDELVPRPWNNLRPEDIEKLVATGFLRMAPDGTAAAGADPALARNQVLADTLQIVSSAVLGLTVGCAQCHNHRYDPISQADYFRLRAILEPALDCRNWKAPPARRISLYTDADRQRAAEIEQQAKEIDTERAKKQQEYIERTFEKELAKLPEELREPVRAARNAPPKERTAEQTQLLKEHPSVNVTAGSLYLYDRQAADELKQYADRAAEVRAGKPVEEFVRALTEPVGQTPPDTFIFYRGDHQQPRQRVAPAELDVLRIDPLSELPENDDELPTTGRRLAYARWLTSGRHPLTARVLVNRVWGHHFGRGIVETPGDFGVLGVPPTHPELLDWLADELVRGGWSLKRLHRTIMLSSVYRQASRRTPELDAVDTDNRLYGRMPVRRLEAEVIRDLMLQVAGQLQTRLGGPPVPVMADRVGQFVLGIENLNAGRPGEVIPLGADEFRRSVYVQVRRSRPLSELEAFDAPAMEPNCAQRTTSTVAPQSLLLMNGERVIELSAQFARRVAAEAGSEPEARLRRAWQLACGTPPDAQVVERGLRFLAAQTEYFQQLPAAGDSQEAQAGTLAPDLEALAAFCHALLSSNQFLYVD
ncbi:MAG: PSD1 domain-containing protein [Pirellulaceae bacterium]|nr:PSD1 domain-containing protein [Pirellulaceae bacterium]